MMQFDLEFDIEGFSFSQVDTSFIITPPENWYGTCQSSLIVTDACCSDTSTFTANVMSVNDPPQDFALLVPLDDEIGVSQTPIFEWEAAFDPDIEDTTFYSLEIYSDSSMINQTCQLDVGINIAFVLTVPLQNNSEYWWRVIAIDLDSSISRSDPFKFTVGQYLSTSDLIEIPKRYELLQNYPNPFNPSTNIRYGIPEAAAVSLVIYDIRGEIVKTIDSRTQVAGWYEHVWNGQDESGQPVSTGLYLTRLQAGAYSKVIKMLYLK